MSTSTTTAGAARPTGTVFRDADDGLRSAGEAGLAGQGVTLAGADATGHAVSRTTTTDLDGRYAFNGLDGGSYAVAVATPAGFSPDRALPTT